MQPPYTVAQMAERAGTGDHTPPPADVNRCISCGEPIPSGRIYCSRTACIRKHNTSGKSRERHYEPFPAISRYNA